MRSTCNVFLPVVHPLLPRPARDGPFPLFLSQPFRLFLSLFILLLQLSSWRSVRAIVHTDHRTWSRIVSFKRPAGCDAGSLNVIYGSITILTKSARVYRRKILRDGGRSAFRQCACGRWRGDRTQGIWDAWNYVRSSPVPTSCAVTTSRNIGRRAVRYGLKPRDTWVMKTW